MLSNLYKNNLEGKSFVKYRAYIIKQRSTSNWLHINMVGIVQLVERQIVALEVVGSSPTIHPIYILHWGIAKW